MLWVRIALRRVEGAGDQTQADSASTLALMFMHCNSTHRILVEGDSFAYGNTSSPFYSLLASYETWKSILWKVILSRLFALESRIVWRGFKRVPWSDSQSRKLSPPVLWGEYHCCIWVRCWGGTYGCRLLWCQPIPVDCRRWSYQSYTPACHENLKLGNFWLYYLLAHGFRR